MECPKCKTEMEKGFLIGHGKFWKRQPTNTISKLFFATPKFGSKEVITWRCTKCQYMELQSK